ncbi:MAG: hypothetical protein ACRCT8_15450 [Lacipirellulaceae bacterium]
MSLAKSLVVSVTLFAAGLCGARLAGAEAPLSKTPAPKPTLAAKPHLRNGAAAAKVAPHRPAVRRPTAGELAASRITIGGPLAPFAGQVSTFAASRPNHSLFNATTANRSPGAPTAAARSQQSAAAPQNALANGLTLDPTSGGLDAAFGRPAAGPLTGGASLGMSAIPTGAPSIGVGVVGSTIGDGRGSTPFPASRGALGTIPTASSLTGAGSGLSSP